MQINDDWVNDGIANQQTFYTASPTAGNLIQSTGPFAGSPTVFSIEINNCLTPAILGVEIILSHNQSYSVAELKKIIALPDREEAYYQLVELFLTGIGEIREEIITGWAYGTVWRIPSAPRLSCRVGESRSNRSRILALLAYYAISTHAAKQDVRDILIALAVIYHCILRSGLDPAEIFGIVSKTAVPSVREIFDRFVGRDDAEKSLTAFRLVEVVNADGEVEIWPDFYLPLKDTSRNFVEVSA